jgi:hypothetical protein
MRLLPRLLSALICCMLIAGCSDDECDCTDIGTDVLADAGPADANQADDAAADSAADNSAKTDAGAEAAPAADAFVLGDANTTICDPSCLSEAPGYNCVKVNNSCEACTETAHCAANPHSLGPKCDTTFNICYCDTDLECAGHVNGFKCDPGRYMCSCETNADCHVNYECTGSLAGAKVCQLKQ